MDDGRQDNMPEQPLQLTRRSDLDWLRVLAVLLLVPYHSAIIFSSLPQTQVVYVYDSQHSLLLMKTVDFMYLWHMPLLFVVAGAASWFALGVRSGRRYLGERVNRLLVPLLFGMVVLLPPTLYLWTRTVPRLAARFPTCRFFNICAAHRGIVWSKGWRPFSPGGAQSCSWPSPWRSLRLSRSAGLRTLSCTWSGSSTGTS
jgi:hypothetical protein